MTTEERIQMISLDLIKYQARLAVVEKAASEISWLDNSPKANRIKAQVKKYGGYIHRLTVALEYNKRLLDLERSEGPGRV